MTPEPRLDADEKSVLSTYLSGDWRPTTIFRSGGGQWRREARYRLKRKGLLESHPSIRRAWRLTPAGRALLSKEPS